MREKTGKKPEIKTEVLTTGITGPPPSSFVRRVRTVLEALELRQKLVAIVGDPSSRPMLARVAEKALFKVQKNLLLEFRTAIQNWQKTHSKAEEIKQKMEEIVSEGREIGEREEFTKISLEPYLKRIQTAEKIEKLNGLIQEALGKDGIDEQTRAFEIALTSVHNSGPLLEYFFIDERNNRPSQYIQSDTGLAKYLSWLSDMTDQELKMTPQDSERIKDLQVARISERDIKRG